MPASRLGLRVQLIRLAGLILGCYLVAMVLAVVFEDRLVHNPSGAESWSPPPVPEIVDVMISAHFPSSQHTDSAKSATVSETEGIATANPVHAWWLPHERSNRVVRHGKAGNLSHRGEVMVHLQQQFQASVLMFDYPGYGKSKGVLSEAGCYESARRCYDWLLNEKKCIPKDLWIVGESLGGGVAINLASSCDCARPIVVSTFTSLPDAASHRLWWLPCHYLMRNRFDSISKIGKVKAPILIAHNVDDKIVPSWQSKSLFEAAPQPKQYVSLAGDGHCRFCEPEFFNAVLAMAGTPITQPRD